MPDLKQTLNSHNAAIDSPELDRSAEAPENDPAASAPEVWIVQAMKLIGWLTGRPQHFIVSSTNLPIPVTAIEDDYKEKYLKLVDQIEKEPLERDDGARNWRFRRKVWILICGVILIVGIAIGVGTGLGISSRNQGSPRLFHNACFVTYARS